MKTPRFIAEGLERSHQQAQTTFSVGLPVAQKDGKKEQVPSDQFSTTLFLDLFNET